MTVHSVSKAKVALGISSLLLIFLLTEPSYSQSQASQSDKVTFLCRNIHLDKLLEELTTQTGTRFIYSSSFVSLDKPVTLRAEKLPLHDVLIVVGNQIGVSFKKQGNYYIVKRNTSAARSESYSIFAPQMPTEPKVVPLPVSEESSEEEDIQSSASRRFQVTLRDTTASVFDNRLPKELFHFGPGLAGWDSTLILRNIPLLLDNKGLQLYRKKWFASAGFTFNDYSFGLEAQAGLPALYGIVSTSFLGDGVHRFGYGLGTAVSIKPGLTANLAYTFGTVRKKETDLFQNIHKSVGQHHQLRLLASISLSKHILVRIGPSFNILNTYHYFQEAPQTIVVVRYRSFTPDNRFPPNSGASSPSYYPIAKTVEYRSAKTWVGFEAALAYRLNFSLRK